MVSKEQGELLSKEWECEFMETSAKLRVGVEQAFTNIASQCAKKIEEEKALSKNRKKKKCTVSAIMPLS